MNDFKAITVCAVSFEGLENFEYKYPEELADKLAKLNEAIDFLNRLKKPSKVVKSQLAYEAIFLVAKIVGFNTFDIDYNIFIEKNVAVRDQKMK